MSICGTTLLGYYPRDEIFSVNFNKATPPDTANLGTMCFLAACSLMMLPSMGAYTYCTITQQMMIAVTFQLMSVFTKLLRFSAFVHACPFESTMIGLSFPFILSAIQSSVHTWFPKEERTLAYSISLIPIAIATTIDFAFVNNPQIDPNNPSDV